jgi:cell division transport system permease protein
MRTALLRHLQVFFDTLGRMVDTPVSSLVTITILGVAVSMPLMLFKITESIEVVSSQLQSSNEITLFLARPEDENTMDGETAVDQDAMDIGSSILQIPAVENVEVIARDQALADFREASGFGDLLDALGENPLPTMLVVSPVVSLEEEPFRKLVERLREIPGVEALVYDQQWRQKLSAIITLLQYASIILATLMGIGVVLVIANTVRTGIVDRSDEIEIIDQIGGTAAFIRRPFLYFGVIQGIAGALAALAISNACIYVLGDPINTLSRLYESQFRIQWVDFRLSAVVIAIAALLGWLAARVTMGGYIRRLRASVRGK